jgi:hypothetical protein
LIDSIVYTPDLKKRTNDHLNISRNCDSFERTEEDGRADPEKSNHINEEVATFIIDNDSRTTRRRKALPMKINGQPMKSH